MELEPEEKAASVYTVQEYDPYRSWSGSQYGSRFSLDHPGTRPLSAADLSRPLGPEHPGTRVLGPPSLTYTSLQTTSKSTYSNSRPGIVTTNDQYLMLSKHDNHDSAPLTNHCEQINAQIVEQNFL